MNLFESANTLQKTVKVVGKTRVGRVKVSVVLKRDGKVVKDLVRPVVIVKPKKVVERVDKVEYSLSSEEAEFPGIRRAVLGKRVYLQREDIIQDLVRIYGCCKDDLKRLSLASLRKEILKRYEEDSKLSESLLLLKDESKEEVGDLMKSFRLVSSVDSSSVAYENDGVVDYGKKVLPDVHKGLVEGCCRKCGGVAVRDNKITEVLFWCESCCEYSE